MIRYLIFVVIICFSINGISQTFNLQSKNFKLGDVYLPGEPIIFSYDKWDIRPESYAILDSVAEFLRAHEELVVEVGNHTDTRWREEYGLRLDLKRAQSVADYLISRGVFADQLTAKGYGSEKPIIPQSVIDTMKSDEAVSEAHATNRRTEFKIIDIKKPELDSSNIYTIDQIEKRPEFSGGDKALIMYLLDSCPSPIIMGTNTVDDISCWRFHIHFVIDKLGFVRNVEVINDNCENEEFKALLADFYRNMPRWIPGELNGKKVNVRYYIPVHWDPSD